MMPGIFSPDTDMFSTPPTTPIVAEEIRPSLSRRQSRPSSLRIQHSAVPDIILDHQTSPEPSNQTQGKGSTPLTATMASYQNGVNGSYVNGHHPNGQSSSSTSQNIHSHSPLVHAHGSSQQMTSTEGQPLRSPRPPSAMTSPCFVHSKLQGPSFTDWLQNTQAKTNGPGLIPGGTPYRVPHSDGTMSDYSYDGNEHHVQLDEDDSASSLTKHLAETAVGVREMSKQLGECISGLWQSITTDRLHVCRSNSRPLRHPVHPHRHQSPR